jgi:hypothetical protein
MEDVSHQCFPLMHAPEWKFKMGKAAGQLIMATGVGFLGPEMRDLEEESEEK